MKNANNKKTIDGYLIADVMLVVSIFLLLLFYIKKISPLVPTTSIGLLTLVLISQMLQNAQVKNSSENTVLAKDESSDQLVKIRPNEVHSGLDGINLCGKVFKLPDGVHAKIGADGQVKVLSFIGRFIYKVRGGELNVSPDAGWNNLFDVKL